MRIPIAQPFLGDSERRAVLAVLDSGQLVQGSWVADFEARFAALVGARHAVATSSGSTALTTALLAHGIGPGDEVIVPAFSFFATASSVLAVGALPVLADVEPQTFTLCPESARGHVNSRTRAIVPVHLFGQPADLGALSGLCREHRLLLIEDAAQAHLAEWAEVSPLAPEREWSSQRVGAQGTACFSFHPSKNLTTGEGGMVLTQDAEVARRARLFRNQGMETRYLHEVVGFNFRMSNLCAAIGVAQLERLEEWTQRRIDNAAFYNARLGDPEFGSAHFDRARSRASTDAAAPRPDPARTRGLRPYSLPFVRTGARHVYHQYTLLAPDLAQREATLEHLRAHGIDARVYYPRGLHEQPALAHLRRGSLPVTEDLCRRSFSIPVHPHLSAEALDEVARCVIEAADSPLR